MPTILSITVGLQGSGKTFQAHNWARQHPGGGAMVTRDLLRIMLHGGYVGDRQHEDQVTAMQIPGITQLLLEGTDVVVHDTNLNPAIRDGLLRVAKACGAKFEVWDFTSVPLELCLERNRGREGDDRVPDDVVLRTYNRWLREAHETRSDPLGPHRKFVTNRWT